MHEASTHCLITLTQLRSQLVLAVTSFTPNIAIFSLKFKGIFFSTRSGTTLYFPVQPLLANYRPLRRMTLESKWLILVTQRKSPDRFLPIPGCRDN